MLGFKIGNKVKISNIELYLTVERLNSLIEKLGMLAAEMI